MFKTLALIALVSLVVVADKPIDLPCVTWIPLTSTQPTDPTNLFVAAYTWVLQDGFGDCIEKGDIFPCFASDTGVDTWGHHDYQATDIPSDYCRTYYQGNVYLSNNMYVPQKGPKWKTWKWTLAQKGGVVPANAIRYGKSVMARSTVNAPGYCCGKGFTGWAVGETNGTFGDVYFSITSDPVVTDTFEVAICEAYHPTTVAPTSGPTQPPPTVPPNTKPYIRFGHTIAASHNVDAVITQGTTSYTWTNYAFSQFSTWVEIFQNGYGNITIYENNKGSRGPALMTKTIPLTPGPLVVVIKDYWPPSVASNVETIAASYIPIDSGAGVRLFNLSPDTPSSGMKVGGVTLIDQVKYTIGSSWVPIPDVSQTFTVFNDRTGATLAQDTVTPPAAPFVFTNFLIGLNSVSPTSKFYTRVIPLIDAPE